jgi:hypothetical protein
MGTQVELAAKRLFDKDALGVVNIKFYPGTKRDLSAEDFAEQLNKSLSQLEAGNAELVEID